MVDRLVLTTAELGFLLRVRPPALAGVREELALPAPRAPHDGLDSLVHRGLATRTGRAFRPSPRLAAVIEAAATADRITRMLGWRGDVPVLTHLLSGPRGQLRLCPDGAGGWDVRLLEPGVTASAQAGRFLDAHLSGDRESSVLLKIGSPQGNVSMAVAVDGQGRWSMSDSLSVPTTPSSRAIAVARIAELLAG
ncbi:hypothetical protein KCV87_07770 [Actinosynnema pretiosum subsp. pretiosum]|uniref:Uncharacterized protein n=2 Tax=Actinosynnema TaxID=40566 RepID=C6WL38_ACTMD|nr:hypothetical protein [Actinosynnema mirum]ACU36391.1 hypothetical protein Amir_2451 [Actinosynnema mirum DSM 43827]AXX29840.1 cell wall-plasma membrane linker protein [Actinosynnema pretiosum subsp. pretiosum]QUF05955.1 hypothetical protein KCV87_07770 [Actinosynnema pretiosum subsp. pretiosum]